MLALAVAAFGIGTTEFVMMGLLPEVATDLGVSIPAAGGYISLYALGVVVGAPVLTALGMRMRRKSVLLGMMALFTAGNVLSALAPTHELLLGARLLSGLPHGTFFGVGAVVAANLAAPGKRAQAISMMFLGLTTANVVGVPVGTLLGQELGWRWAFGLVAVIGVLAFTAVAALVPNEPAPEGASLRGELRAFRNPQVWLAFAVVVFGFAATFSFYSYIKPVLTDVSGYSPTSVTLLLALFGTGMTAGTALGGRLADRAPLRTLHVFLAGLALALSAFALTAHYPVVAAGAVFLIGLTGFAAIPSIQAQILDHAQDAPALGSASIQSTFNIANSLGAYLGGLVIAAGFGLTSPSWVGALLALVGLGFALLSGGLQHRARRQTAQTTAAAPAEIGEPGTVEVATVRADRSARAAATDHQIDRRQPR
nr:MFS transporter [Saccharopolyspora sp. HNM0983]